MTDITEIPDYIDQFVNLKELVFYSITPEIFHDKCKTNSLDRSNTPELEISTIPIELSFCNNLEVLRIPDGELNTVNMALPKNLRIIFLPARTDLNAMIDELIQLEILEELHCFQCELSEANRQKLLGGNTELRLVITEDELFDKIRNIEKYSVGICNVGLVFETKDEARYFIMSFPQETRDKYDIRYTGRN